MGKALYDAHPVFREALDRCAAIFDAELDRRLQDLLFAPEGTAEADLLNQTGYTQPALFAFEYALAQLWLSWGVTPDVVMGHSVGEIAAMCVAGAMSLEDGLTLIAARGRLMQALPAGGGMTSVMASEDVVSHALVGREAEVAIAAINAPNQIVISGVGSVVAEIAERLGAGGVRTKALNVSHAFHSPLMQPMLEEYARTVSRIRCRSRACRW
jgi:epothilone polyketide synthase A